MKIILFGSNGMLGSYVGSYLGQAHEVVKFTRKDLDISLSSKKEIMKFLNKHVQEEDLIINAAGVIKQRDVGLFEMIKVNSLFPNILADFKNRKRCNVIHITTDCVFSGKKGQYTEDDLHDCLDDYGKTKSLGENPNLTTIRTSIIGEELNNKVSLLEWAKSKKSTSVHGYVNHLWNGVTCLELAKMIKTIILQNDYWQGVKHFFSKDTVSKNKLLHQISDVYDLQLQINEHNTKICVYRNLFSNFAETKTDKTIKEQLQEMKDYNLLERHK